MDESISYLIFGIVIYIFYMENGRFLVGNILDKLIKNAHENHDWIKHNALVDTKKFFAGLEHNHEKICEEDCEN